MSEFEVSPFAFGAVMVTGLFVVSVLMSGLAFANSTKIHIEDSGMISERSILHVLENCLMNGRDYIDYDFIRDQNSDLCRMCGICDAGDPAARIERGSEIIWESRGYVDPNTEEEAHEIFINLKRDDVILIGKLILRVNK